MQLSTFFNNKLVHHNSRLFIKRGFSAIWALFFFSNRFFRLFSLRLLLLLGLAASRLRLLRRQNLLDVTESFLEISIGRFSRIRRVDCGHLTLLI